MLLIICVVIYRTGTLLSSAAIFFSQGALLKPHIPLLVIALLESLSGLENQV